MPASTHSSYRLNAHPREVAMQGQITATNSSPAHSTYGHGLDTSRSPAHNPNHFSVESGKQYSAPQPRQGQKSRTGSGDKKKSGGMFGFLTLKEPSTSAWEEFAQQQRVAAQKGGRPSVVGLPGVSSQKLPDHVPPVNSKWDGLTENAKRKAMERSKRDSMGTQQSSRSEQSFSSDSSGSTYKYGSIPNRPSISQQGRPPSHRSSYSNSTPRSPQVSLQRTVIPDATPWDQPSGQYGEAIAYARRKSHHSNISKSTLTTEHQPNIEAHRLSKSKSGGKKRPESKQYQPHAYLSDWNISPGNSGSNVAGSNDEVSPVPPTRSSPHINFSRPKVRPKDSSSPSASSQRLSFVPEEHVLPDSTSTTAEPFVFFEDQRLESLARLEDQRYESKL